MDAPFSNLFEIWNTFLLFIIIVFLRSFSYLVCVLECPKVYVWCCVEENNWSFVWRVQGATNFSKKFSQKLTLLILPNDTKITTMTPFNRWIILLALMHFLLFYIVTTMRHKKFNIHFNKRHSSPKPKKEPK